MTPHPVTLAPAFFAHRKIHEAGDLGVALFVKSLGFSALNLTDGYVPADQLGQLVHAPNVLLEHHSALVPIPVSPELVAERLTEAGLWRPVSGGFVIHEYGLYQPTRDVLEQRRLRDRLRKRDGRSQLEVSARIPGGPSTSQRSSSVAEPSASVSVQPGLELGSFSTAETAELGANGSGPPKGTLAWFVAQLRDANSRTPTAIATVLRVHSLPEAALYAALEEVEAGGSKVRSPARLFVAKLTEYGRSGRYAR